jgi:hypothetical protein
MKNTTQNATDTPTTPEAENQQSVMLEVTLNIYTNTAALRDFATAFFTENRSDYYVWGMLEGMHDFHDERLAFVEMNACDDDSCDGLHDWWDAQQETAPATAEAEISEKD